MPLTWEGTSVIMIDGGSGEILYEKNAEERRDPASITKILTCLVVLENMDLDDEITVAEDYDGAGENIAVKADERFTVEQLLYAMMVGSANDAAEVLALAAGGDMETFCDMMNERAKECGAKNTSFTNPNGMNYAGTGKSQNDGLRYSDDRAGGHEERYLQKNSVHCGVQDTDHE